MTPKAKAAGNIRYLDLLLFPYGTISLPPPVIDFY